MTIRPPLSPSPQRVGRPAEVKTADDPCVASGATVGAVVMDDEPIGGALACERASAVEALLDSKRSKVPVPSAPPGGMSNARLRLMVLSRSADIVLDARPTVVDARVRVPDPGLAVAAGGAAVMAFCEPLLKDQLVTKHYDSQVFVNRFLDHREQLRDKSPAAAFGGFEANANTACVETGGSHCVGLASCLVDDLRQRGLQALWPRLCSHPRCSPLAVRPLPTRSPWCSFRIRTTPLTVEWCCSTQDSIWLFPSWCVPPNRPC